MKDVVATKTFGTEPVPLGTTDTCRRYSDAAEATSSLGIPLWLLEGPTAVVQDESVPDQRGGGLVTFSGPSGSGKSTIAAAVARRDSRATVHRKDSTRPARPDEPATGGAEIRLVSPSEFCARQCAGAYVARYWRNNAWYGILRDQVTTALRTVAWHLVIVSDMATVELLRRRYAGRITSLLVSVDLDTARLRLERRGSEATTPRLAGLAAEQAEYFNHLELFDEVLDNTGPLAATVEQLLAVLQRPARTPERWAVRHDPTDLVDA